MMKIHMLKMLNNSHSSTLKPSTDNQMFALWLVAGAFWREKKLFFCAATNVRMEQFSEKELELII